jgi:hypothetical protein
LVQSVVDNALKFVFAATLLLSGVAYAQIPVTPGGGGGSSASVCPLKNATNICITEAPYNAVGNGTTDNTAAFIAAIAALNAQPGCGTIWGPAGVFAVNGPLLDTSGANAVLPMPTIPNYDPNLCLISIRGYQPATTPNVGFVIKTSHTGGGSFIGGFDSATGGGFPPFTNVWLDLQDVLLLGPDNPDFVMVNALHIIDFTHKNLVIETATNAQPSNAAGWGIRYPTLANGTHLVGEGFNAILGFYNCLQTGEHLNLSTMDCEFYVNGIVADNGANIGAYRGNTAHVTYAWLGPGNNQIAAGPNKSALQIDTVDFEHGTGLAVNDPSNLIYGVGNYNVPEPIGAYNYCAIPVSGGTNFTLKSLWCPAVTSTFVPTLNLVDNWQSQDGSGTTLANTGSDSTNSAATTSVTWVSATGFTGNVATYNGTSSLATATSAASTNFDGTTPFSVCAWINVSSYAFNAAFIADNLNSTATTGWGLGIFGTTSGTAGRIIADVMSASGNGIFMQTTAATIPATGTLNLACMTYDATKTAAGTLVYVNGSVAATTASQNNLTGSIASGQSVMLGESRFGGQFFPGAIGRVRVYSRLLSASDISQMFALGPNTF